MSVTIYHLFMPHTSTFVYRRFQLVALLTFWSGLSSHLWAQTLTPSSSQNYVLEQMPRDAATSLPATINYQTIPTRVSYLDGLGQPIQTVQWRGSGPGTQDVTANSTDYDSFGRPYVSVIPVPSGTMGDYSDLNTRKAAAVSFYNDASPIVETRYEASPLNRVTQQFGPGNAWRSPERPVSTTYTTTSSIYHYYVADDGRVTAATSTNQINFYNAADLTVKISTDEQGNQTKDFTDLEGKVIRKDVVLSTSEVLSTRYVYDDLGRLAAIFSPKSPETFGSIDEVNNPLFDELIFAYKYDGRGRIIRKHIPSAGWTDLVYDTSDRLVMSQDEQDRNEIKWRFSRYDALNRPVQTGQLTLNRSAANLQTDFDALSRDAFPATVAPGSADLLTESYYDSYTNVPLTFNADGAFTSPFPSATTPAVRGLPTSGRIRNLETSEWYAFAIWYDDRTRIIQQQSQNHLGGTDRSDTQYRFNGEVLQTVLRHQKGANGPITTVTSQYDYDHVGRKTKLTYSLSPAPMFTMAQYNYDAVGRLSQKLIQPGSRGTISQQTGPWSTGNTWQGNTVPGTTDGVTIDPGHTVTLPASTTYGAGKLVFSTGSTLVFSTGSTLRLNGGGNGANTLQTLDYNYHIRGWLRGINTDASNELSRTGNDLFSLQLKYDDAGQYSGNIGQQVSVNGHTNTNNTYLYSYDKANRLTSGLNLDGYSGVTNITYDKNGNIKSLNRGTADQLTYSYTVGEFGNRLDAVSDGITGNIDVGDFRDTHTGSGDYAYWPDGSMKADLNRGITQIDYNLLKLPRQITFTSGKVVSYTYSASGQKLRMSVTNGETRDYVGPFQYLNNTLFDVANDEGRAVPDGANGYRFEYFHHDHLGNVRVVYRDSLNPQAPPFISQYTDYDPWGLPQLNGLNGGNSTNRNKFNGKEALSELGSGLLDFGARGYDAQIGRWSVVDPHFEKYESISPYSYAFNNPIRFLDFGGKDPGDVAIIFAGANLMAWREPYGTTNTVEQMLRNNYFDQKGGSVRKFVSDYFTISGGSVSSSPGLPYRVKINQGLDGLTQEAYEYIKTNLQKDGRLLICSWLGTNFA